MGNAMETMHPIAKPMGNAMGTMDSIAKPTGNAMETMDSIGNRKNCHRKADGKHNGNRGFLWEP